MVLRSHHLVSSPGFKTKLSASLVAQAILIATFASLPQTKHLLHDSLGYLQNLLLDGAHALKWWAAIATISSACCILQLILSAMALGCSGINAILGPVRPACIAATLLLQAASWHIVCTRKPDQAKIVALSSLASMLITFSPEILHAIHNGKTRVSAHLPGEVLTIKVKKMSCSVCEAKVRSIVEDIPGVHQCDVHLDNSQIRVTLCRDTESSRAEQEIAAALDGGGYPTSCDRVSNGYTKQATLTNKIITFDFIVGGMSGLLGSSCCALQLGLNFLAGTSLGADMGLAAGCLGFNKALGPARKYVRAATATFFCIQWARSRSGKRRVLLLSSFLAAALTYMPEGLLFMGAGAIAPPTEGAVYLRVPIGGMGCEACQHSVSGVLSTSSGVVDAVVRGFDEEGVAELLVNPSWGFNLTDVSLRISEAGFELLGDLAKYSNHLE